MVPTDHTQPDTSTSQKAIILDLDRTGSSWLFHLLLESEGCAVARAPYAHHHHRNSSPPRLTDWLWSKPSSRPLPATAGSPSLASSPCTFGPLWHPTLIPMAAAALLSEMMIRSRVSHTDAHYLFATATYLLDQLATTPCSAAQAALYGLHRLMLELSLLSRSQLVLAATPPACWPRLLFHQTSGEITCARHASPHQGPIQWGSEKVELHLALLSLPDLKAFLENSAPLWQQFGTGLAWAFLSDLVGFAEHTVGSLKTWSFLRQLRPSGRGTIK